MNDLNVTILISYKTEFIFNVNIYLSLVKLYTIISMYLYYIVSAFVSETLETANKWFCTLIFCDTIQKRI